MVSVPLETFVLLKLVTSCSHDVLRVICNNTLIFLMDPFNVEKLLSEMVLFSRNLKRHLS